MLLLFRGRKSSVNMIEKCIALKCSLDRSEEENWRKEIYLLRNLATSNGILPNLCINDYLQNTKIKVEWPFD